MTTIGGTSKLGERVQLGVIVLCGIALFVVLSQPAWRGEQMAAEYTDNCKARGGVLLIHHGALADTYNCEARLDRGVKP